MTGSRRSVILLGMRMRGMVFAIGVMAFACGGSQSNKAQTEAPPAVRPPPTENRLAVQTTSIEGAMSADLVRSLVKQQHAELVGCWDKGERDGGIVQLVLTVDARGTVTNSEIADGYGDEPVVTCINEAARQWKLPARLEGGTTAHLMLTFQPPPPPEPEPPSKWQQECGDRCG